MHAEELWNGESFGARALRTVLSPASWLYAAAWQGYLATYRLGIKRPKEPHRPVICVGNLVAGGSGKTPATLHLADALKDIGRDVAISCSGYGSPASKAAQLAPEGELKASEWGDEAAMLRWLRPEIPLIVGRRRVLAAEICHRELPNAILLMDDGFQHLPLRKHVSLIIDPAMRNRRCLPAGPYREPWRNRSRADLVISPAGEFVLGVEKEGFVDSQGQPRATPGAVYVLCAIGRPGEFVDSLTERGVNPVRTALLRDHDPLTAGNLFDGFDRALPVVVTAKDWVKLRDRQDAGRYEFIIATRDVEIRPRDGFRIWLEERLSGLPH
ncbi:MAG TPA: tetraacyldisaccharide 4'-kinase [Fimbriimonadaceae bacterium]|nr:tetraacyldisaccharide 4'-kinase [Fimbriimonadaceae bacterium]